MNGRPVHHLGYNPPNPYGDLGFSFKKTLTRIKKEAKTKAKKISTSNKTRSFLKTITKKKAPISISQFKKRVTSPFSKKPKTPKKQLKTPPRGYKYQMVKGPMSMPIPKLVKVKPKKLGLRQGE